MSVECHWSHKQLQTDVSCWRQECRGCDGRRHRQTDASPGSARESWSRPPRCGLQQSKHSRVDFRTSSRPLSCRKALTVLSIHCIVRQRPSIRSPHQSPVASSQTNIIRLGKNKPDNRETHMHTHTQQNLTAPLLQTQAKESCATSLTSTDPARGTGLPDVPLLPEAPYLLPLSSRHALQNADDNQPPGYP